MKNLVFIRHAKSSWADMNLHDKDRPLNKRGVRDAPHMAAFLQERLPVIDLIIPSIAKRTRETARFFQVQYGLSDLEIIPTEALYHSGVDAYFHQIWSLDETVETVVLVGHNPTLTEIAYYIQPGLTENVPTCGMLWVEVDINNWANFDFDKVALKGYYYPKMLSGA